PAAIRQARRSSRSWLATEIGGDVGGDVPAERRERLEERLLQVLGLPHVVVGLEVLVDVDRVPDVLPRELRARDAAVPERHADPGRGGDRWIHVARRAERALIDRAE